jgi:predicted ATPase
MHATIYVALCVRLGCTERALNVIARTLAAIARTDERWLEPEIHRLRGEALRSCNAPAEAEQAFVKAVEMTRNQGSPSLELRATLGLHALAAGEGKNSPAAAFEFRQLIQK